MARIRERADELAAYALLCEAEPAAVSSLAGLSFAPLLLLASEGKAHLDESQEWHTAMAHRLCVADPELFIRTRGHIVSPDDEGDRERIRAWWDELAGAQSRGCIVRAPAPVTHGHSGLVLPAVRCRTANALRLAYGPEHILGSQPARGRPAGLSVRRSQALRQLALGAESLERFVRHEPMYRVHECIVAAAALSAEP
jgi:hypothetical protein